MPDPNYDEWKLNPPEPKVIHYCEVCEYEIHENEQYIKVDDSILCASDDCFIQKAREILSPTEEYAGGQ